MKLTAEKITPLFTFISTGDKCAMYTLRIMMQYQGHTCGEPYCFTDSEYVKNLSNDKAKAEHNAKEYSDLWNIPFKGNAEFELNEIRRSRDAEAAAKVAEYERIKAETIRHQEEEYDRVFNEGVMLTGKYTGKTIAEIIKIDPSYVFWMARQADGSKNIYTVGCELAAKYISDNKIESAGHIGQVGDVIEVDVLISRISPFEGFYGTSWVVTCFDDEFRMITFFTTSKRILNNEIGTRVRIQGTVSEHGEYQGYKQTMFKRPKIVKSA